MHKNAFEDVIENTCMFLHVYIANASEIDVISTMRTKPLMVDVHMVCIGYKEQKIIAPQ